MKSVQIFIQSLQNLLFVAMLLTAGLVVLNQTYFQQKYKFFSVLSGSMEPTLPVGSIVVVTGKETYLVDDVVTAKSNTNSKETVTHRIFSIEKNDGEEQFLLKGDANEDPDLSLIGKKQIVGEVIFTIPVIGKIIELTKTQQGFIFIIVIPATIFAYHEVLSIVDEVRKMFRKWKERRREGRMGKKEHRTKDEEENRESRIKAQGEDTRHETQDNKVDNQETGIEKKRWKMKVIGKGSKKN